MRWLRAGWLWRRAFWCFAAVLFIATHTPGVQLGGKVRVDLVVHLAAFGGWTGLLLLAAYFGRWGSWSNVRVVWPIAASYAAIDEALQAVPFVHRHAAVDDWAADLLGASIACALAMLADRWFLTHPEPESPS